MTELSPAAQAVLDAVTAQLDWDARYHSHSAAAAALRAAAGQGENLYDPHEGKVSVVRVEHLLAIATELENQ